MEKDFTGKEMENRESGDRQTVYDTYNALISDTTSETEKNFTDMLVIRRFEENLLRLFRENKLFGTTHTCIGQEAIAVTSMRCVNDGDIVFSNHRCHGHFIAYSHHPEYLLKEIMGKRGGVCEGRGGSQHIKYNNFFSNGIQGGIVPNAVGAAWAEKIKGTGNIAVVFLGDGTLGQGIVYESFNISSLKEIPVLFIVEENGYAMSTGTDEAVSGTITARADAFGIASMDTDGNEFETLQKSMEQAFVYVRQNCKPFMLVAHTYRLAAHSKGDDVRAAEEVNKHRMSDPILTYGAKLSGEARAKISQSVDMYIHGLTKEAEMAETAESPKGNEQPTVKDISGLPAPKFKRCIEYINYALSEAAKENRDVIIMGEDVRDPYGGAFKATKGLSTRFPDQVINMPISEAAICGISVGMALRGIRPVAEIMFGDFITLIMDQLVNHASKYRWVYGDGVIVPLIIRTPMGGRRGYGPTHSQSLEKMLIGIPEVLTIALSPLHNPVELYRIAFQQQRPVVIVENKVLYTRPVMTEKDGLKDFAVKRIHNYAVPTYLLSLTDDSQVDATLITYGGMASECVDAALKLMIEEEISVNILVLGQLSEMPWKDIESVKESIYLAIAVEEGTLTGGVGAEIIAGVSERGIGERFSRIAAPDQPIPNSLYMEKKVLPDADSIAEKVRMIINE